MAPWTEGHSKLEKSIGHYFFKSLNNFLFIYVFLLNILSYLLPFSEILIKHTLYLLLFHIVDMTDATLMVIVKNPRAARPYLFSYEENMYNRVVFVNRYPLIHWNVLIQMS